MEKLMPIINVVLTIIAVVVSVITLLSVNGVKTLIEDPPEEGPKTTESVPLSQLTEYNITDNFIFQFPRPDNPDDTMSVVLEVGFALNKENEQTATIVTQLAEKENLVRDRIQKLIRQKDATAFQTVAAQEALQQELLDLVKSLFETDAFVDVYFDVLLN